MTSKTPGSNDFNRSANATQGATTSALSNTGSAQTWLWRGALGGLAAILVCGLGLVAALAVGWRSPTPRRSPDWTSGDNEWRYFGDGSIEASAVGVTVQLWQADQRAWAVTEKKADSFEAELAVRSRIPSEDVGYGILYRYQNPNNFYLFAIGGDGYYTIAAFKDGKPTPLRNWQQWPHIHRGAARNRLRVHCDGVLCRFYVNDEFTAEISDDTYSSGNVGFWAQTFSDERLDLVLERMRLWSVD